MEDGEGQKKKKRKKKKITPLYIHWYFPWFSNKQSEKDRKTALCNSPRKKQNKTVDSPSAQLCFNYNMIHSLYLKPLPIPVPASLKAMYVYKSKPHDPWDSRQSVHWLLNYDLENIRKSKNQNLTSSHPYLRRGTQVRDNIFLIAIKVPLRSNLTGCMIAWTFVDLEMRGKLRNKTRKPRRNMLYTTFRLEN